MSSRSHSSIHRKLPKRSIRLLELLDHAGGSNEIVLRLKTYTLEDAPRFNALSYAWGELSENHRVSCWGEQDSQLHDIEIGNNLFVALPYLKAASSKPIWIDAICIDQKNDGEKGEVVPMMGNYYGKASEVLIWLGPAYDKSDLALDVLRYISYPSERDAIQATISSLDETLEPANLAALLSALSNGEHIHQPETDTVRLGLPGHSHTLWQALPALYQRPWFYRVWTFQEACLAVNARIMWIGRESREFTPLRDFQNYSSNGDGFVLFLNGLRARKSTLKEDRIFGVLALAPPGIRAWIEVAYSKDDPVHYVHLYTVMAVALLRWVPLETVLDLATVSARADQMPSWVPDWSMRQTSETQSSRFLADASHLRGPSVDVEDQRVLIVRGQEIDKVKEVIDGYSYDRPSDARGIDGPADRMHQWLNRCEDLARRTIGSPAAAAEALWQTLTAYSETHDEDNQALDHERGFVAHRERLEELRDSVPLAQTKLSTADRQSLGRILRRMSGLLRGKVFFSTSRGTIGIAERGIAAGDLICVLFDACKHYVLRPYETGEYALKAVAYVHGFMEDVEAALQRRDGYIPLEARARNFRIC